MAKLFRWHVERAPTATVKYRTVVAQFGDGYKQVSADGINTKDESYAITVSGDLKTAKEIMAFFDEHNGTKSFLWRPPLGDLALFTCDDPTPSQKSTNFFVITANFVKAFSSIGG